MKRFIAFFVVGFTLFSSAKAQVSFGAKAGSQLTSLPGHFSNNSKLGLHGGITASMPLEKSFSLQAELYYSQQGNKVDLLFTDEMGNDLGTKKVDVNLNYINVPVLVKYAFGDGLFAETGLQVGFLMSAKMKGAGASYNIKSDTKKVDLYLPIGVGYQLKNGLGLNFRYNFGLTDVTKSKLSNPHNRVAQLGLFYVLKNKH